MKMSSQRSLSETSREELYDLIWSTPASTLCKEFGVSDVAVAKRCRKWNVPRPPRGYWAKPPSKRPKKPALPPTPAEAFLLGAKEPVPSTIKLPDEGEPLHPKALELLDALNKTKPDSDKLLRVQIPTLPEVKVSKDLARRAAIAFHVMIQDTEQIGITFSKSQGRYSSGTFRKGNDFLYVEIQEGLVEKESARPKRRSQYWYGTERSPSGRLTITLREHGYSRKRPKSWDESEKLPPEKLLPMALQEIRRYFIDAHEQRERAAIEEHERAEAAERKRIEYEAAEAVRRLKQRKRRHRENIEKAFLNRSSDLVKAAEWWRLQRVVAEFIAACETRWRGDQDDRLTPQQEAWLLWARESAATLSPFDAGYPDPERDGAFDPQEISENGPYPPVRRFPQPPPMPVIPTPVVTHQEGKIVDTTIPPKPYPFWLKHQRR